MDKALEKNSSMFQKTKATLMKSSDFLLQGCRVGATMKNWLRMCGVNDKRKLI